ncbi:hypothetical protein [Pseudoalteromonas sp. S16_S37]|uniref:hypothetical protein n=1 Tax=Pseudoalteromonas sp. S16_S37 TaxID=2720228 RepID=UPI001681339C|nr:hypothetical protein [Pseudoalteromonas sp. S16_S37]MBD1581576.1 hypothetical protein [Pseudoalteromonas sp. S16_S37]
MEKSQVLNDVSLGYADPQIDELLKHSIRTQLESLLKSQVTVEQRQKLLQKSFVDAMALVLSGSKVEHKVLIKAFETMYEHAVQSMAQAKLSQELLTRQYISATGLIMSPHNCKHTIKDVYRIKGYARGVDQAIQGKLKHKPSITILYPACGPFAPLLLPLLSYYKDMQTYSAKQLQVMLVDVHPGAVITLRQLVKDLQLEDYIALIEEADATEFKPDTAIDLLVLEAMQHGFTKEGQLSIAKHLVKFLNIDGWMIPQNVSVRGMMVIGETEFNQQWKQVDYSHSNNMAKDALQDRVELGEIININKSTLLNMQELELQDGIKVIPANQIVLPKDITDMSQRIFAVYAHVETFAQEEVGQYDSGITHPRPDTSVYIDIKPKDIEHTHFVANSGDTVQFYYQISGLPGFVPVKV